MTVLVLRMPGGKGGPDVATSAWTAAADGPDHVMINFLWDVADFHPAMKHGRVTLAMPFDRFLGFVSNHQPLADLSWAVEQ